MHRSGLLLLATTLQCLSFPTYSATEQALLTTAISPVLNRLSRTSTPPSSMASDRRALPSLPLASGTESRYSDRPVDHDALVPIGSVKPFSFVNRTHSSIVVWLRLLNDLDQFRMPVGAAWCSCLHELMVTELQLTGPLKSYSTGLAAVLQKRNQ